MDQKQPEPAGQSRKKPKKVIPTPVLTYWGFDRHPFSHAALKKEEDLQLFVNRDDEVRRLHNSLTSPIGGTYGLQGTGKSSVLFQVARRVQQDGVKVVTVDMTGKSENLLWQQVAAAILSQMIEGSIKVSGKSAKELAKERELLDYGIKFTSSVEAGGEIGIENPKAILRLIAKGGVKEDKEIELPKHNEATAVDLISDLAQASDDPMLIIVDNFERVRNLLKKQDYFRFVTEFAQTVEARFKDPGIAFLMTLDSGFADIIENSLPDKTEAISYGFGELVKTPFFKPKDFFEIIQQRVGKLCKLDVESFIQRDAFWALMLSTAGHARRAFAVIREAMEIIEERRTKKILTFDIVRQAIKKKREEWDETDYKILSFLAEQGAHSPSDACFQEAIGLVQSTLHTKLSNLYERQLLEVSHEKVGKATKDLYSVPAIGNGIR